MKRPENPTKVIKGTAILGGDGDCCCLFVEEDTVEIIDGNRKEKLLKRSWHRKPSLYFKDIFPTPYKESQDLDRDRFQFRIEVEVEVIRT